MSKAVAKAEAKAVAAKVEIRPAELVEQDLEVADIAGLPEEFKRGDTLTGFPPSPKFETPGDAVFGYFITMREGVGPNNSRLYELSVPRKGEEPKTIAVWGSAALDRLFDSAFPPVQVGDKVGIIYIGQKPTKRGLNPVKLFAIKVLHLDGKAQASHAA